MTRNVLFLAVLILSTLHSQTTAQMQPSDSTLGRHLTRNATPAMPHERFATFLADDGFKSQLVIQNLRIDLPITAQPTLILKDGEIALDPVSIPAHTSATVDINAALKAHGKSDKKGAIVVHYEFGTYGAMSAVVEMADYLHHVYLNSVAQSAEEFWYGTDLDAVVWAPGEGTQGSMSLINTSSEPRNVKVNFFVGERAVDTREVNIPSRQDVQLTLDSAIKRAAGAAVGVHVSFVGQPGDIVAEGALSNKKTGFSKYIRFMDSSLKFPSASLRTNFLLLGAQPSADGFPANMSFASVAAVRNIDNVEVKVTPLIKYLQDGTVRNISLRPFTLRPGQSSLLDFLKQQKSGLIPSDFSQGSLELVPDGEHKIIAELFNFNEKTGGYVIGSSFAARPARATSSVWRTDGSFQTTIVVQNTAPNNDQLTLKLFADGDSYEKTFDVPAGGLVKINLKELQQQGVSDNVGHLLTSTSGTLSMSGVHGIDSALAFDKIIHSADESEYVGLLAQPCNFVTDISGFLSGTQNPFIAEVDDDWTDGEVTVSGCCLTGVGNPSLVQYGPDPNPNSGNTLVTLISVDNSPHAVNLDFTQTTTTCDICSGDTLRTTATVTVPAFDSCQNGNVTVSANTINSACVQASETALASLIGLPSDTSFKVTKVSAKADNTITITQAAAFNDIGYTAGSRSATLKFQTNLGGNITWTFTASCRNGETKSFTKAQAVQCPKVGP